MAKKKDYKPPHAQREAKPSIFTALTEAAGTAIAYGLQIARASAYSAGMIAYDLFQRFYQGPVTTAPEIPTTRTAITAEPPQRAVQEPTTIAPLTTTPRKKKPKPKKPGTPITFETRRDHSASNVSEASSETADRTISPTSTPSETPSPKTAADIKELLDNELPTEESVGDDAQGKYYLRHLKQLQTCLNNLKDTHIENDRYKHYETLIATTGSSIEEKIIRIGQIYNQLMAELKAPEFEQNLFCMLPYTLEDSKISGQKVTEVLERLEKLRAIFIDKGIQVEFFLCGSSILAPNLAQDIDITIHARMTDGEALTEKMLVETFLSLGNHLEEIGFNYKQLVTDRRYTHLVSMPSIHGEIKVDVTYYNTSVEDTLNKGLTNISAVYLGVNGDMHATKQIAEFYKEETTSSPKVVMLPSPEPTDSAYNHVAKVAEKAKQMGWNNQDVKAWLHENSARPTLASPPKSHEEAISKPETSPIAAAFHAALEAKRAAAALAAETTSSP